MKPPHQKKIFGVDLIPNIGIKQSTKSHKAAVDTGDCYQTELLHFGQDQRPLTPYQPSPHTTKSPAFLPQDQRPLIATNPRHPIAHNQASQSRTNLHPLTS